MSALAPALAEDRAPLPAGFEPETVLPSQLLDTSNLGAAMQPEKRLMLAVLEDAIATLQRTANGTSRVALRDFDETRAWLASDDTTWPYTFVNICHVLGFDPSFLRRGLERWLTAIRQKALAGKVGAPRLVVRSAAVIDGIVQPDGRLDGLRVGQGLAEFLGQFEQGLYVREPVVMPIRGAVAPGQLGLQPAIDQRRGQDRCSACRTMRQAAWPGPAFLPAVEIGRTKSI